MNTFQDVELTIEDRVARICINRPEKLNAVRIQTYRELIAGLRKAGADPNCHLILLHGAGNHFTAGNDLADLTGGNQKEVMDCVQQIFETVGSLQKVLLAAVEGAAVGIGTTILLHCDIVCASEATRFRLPFANLGVCPEGGSSVLLPQLVGQKVARELLLTGRFFSASEALDWGLINRVTEPGKALDAASEYIETLLQQPPDSLLATKRAMRASMPDITSLVSTELESFAHLLTSDATQRRIASLLKG